MFSHVNYPLDDICAKVATPEVISAIVVRLGNAGWSVQQTGVQALVELAKFGKAIIEQ